MDIKDLRTKTGLSRRAFYEEFGIPERTLQDWETGKRTPPAYVFDMLKKNIDEYCGNFMQKCFFMERESYKNYVQNEAYSWLDDEQNFTLEDVKESILSAYQDAEIELYSQENAWEEMEHRDYAKEDFYSISRFAEDVYKMYKAMQAGEKND